MTRAAVASMLCAGLASFAQLAEIPGNASKPYSQDSGEYLQFKASSASRCRVAFALLGILEDRRRNLCRHLIYLLVNSVTIRALGYNHLDLHSGPSVTITSIYNDLDLQSTRFKTTSNYLLVSVTRKYQDSN